MKNYLSMKTVGPTLLGLVMVFATSNVQADLWDFLSGRQKSLIPVYEPSEAVPAKTETVGSRLVEKPIASVTTLGETVTAPLRALNPQADTGQAPSAQYTTRWVRVPTTRYVPQLERNSETGWTQLVMKPCTTHTWQLRRVRVTDYRPLVPSLFPSPCHNNEPLLARLLNPILAPGCYGCDVPASSSGSPTPAANGADRRPSLDPHLTQPDTESDMSLDKPPVDNPEGETDASDADTVTPTDEEASSDEEGAAASDEGDNPAADESTSEEADSADESPAEETEEDEKPAAGDATRSVLKQPAIEPPKQKKVPGQEKAEQEKKESDAADDKSAAPYRLQPIPDKNRLPVDPATAPTLIDPRDKTAATPIPRASFTSTDMAPLDASVVRATALKSIAVPVRKLDSSGWTRVK